MKFVLVCMFLCVRVIVWYFRWDSYISHLMVIIGDRHTWLLDCLLVCRLSITDQVSVLNHPIPVYDVYIMYPSVDHVVACYRLHFRLSICLLIVIVESMAIT